MYSRVVSQTRDPD